jgi:hypothetical protein
MPVRQTSLGVGIIAGSSTFFPPRPVEYGRDRGVAALSLITNGTSGATTTNPAATTCERPNLQSGLTVTLTATGGVYTAVAINTAGVNYREGDVLLVPLAAGTGGTVRLIVTNVSPAGAVTGCAIWTNVTAGAVTIGPTATLPEEPSSGPLGLTVNATASGGVVTTLAVVGAGRGYRIGDIVTIAVTGATAPVTASVTALTG